MTPWLLAGIALKLSVYLATAAAIGGSFALFLVAGAGKHVANEAVPGRRGIFSLCILGMFVSGAYFFVRVGEFAGMGWAGAFDPPLMQILWESPVGNVLQHQLAGFTLTTIVLAACPRGRLPDGRWQRPVLGLCYMAALTLLALAFSLQGHSTEHGLIGGAAVTVHVLMALWWAGALYPLWRASDSLDNTALQRVLHRFGLVATGPLLLMVLAGGALLYTLMFAPSGVIESAYAAAVIAKLSLVALLFAIAALHKWRTVPLLMEAGGRARFRRSLSLELILMFAVLALTAVFTTAVGPLDT